MAEQAAKPTPTSINLRLTVNKQFAERFTMMKDQDEIAVVPNSPYPPSSNAK